MIKIGIIGGSGLDDPDILKNVSETIVETKWGRTSCILKEGEIGGKSVVLIGRHGRAHTIPPSQVNNRANIQALKDIGCTHIIATTSVGSLREDIGRGHFVILDQFIDFTKHRDITFYEEFEPGTTMHTSMAEPFNPELREIIIKKAKELNLNHHPKGTVVTIEGPRFSTKAESNMFRLWGADVINMTIAPEAILANEAGIPYAAIAMSTDYDCWKNDEEAVSWESVVEVFKENVKNMIDLLTLTISDIN
ncbi:MAG: S-methyl-5'-thioadenosine phosphorylase [Spirochaetales bacterium]|nr:S-methyl-5'-thioadenosine phosphorylase [Spirochaetales bacterium]